MPNSVDKFSTEKLPTLYQSFIHLSRYARWVEGESRRETWEETVDRYVSYMCDVQCKGKIDKDTKKEIKEAIMNLEVMPSMRCMMTAGKALAQDAISGFNCTYAAIDDVAVFSEIMYLLMCGSGTGISVERQFVNMLPVVADKIKPSRTVIKVEDSRIGWADSYKELLVMLYQGRIPEWDVSEVRPAGAKLKTFGGRASGPAPLVDLFKFTVEIFKSAAGRKLSSLECHDVCCKIAEIVCAGGVRRSAILSLSNPSDDRMRHAKSGNWHEVTPWRSMANNSSCFTEKPGTDVFMREWLALYDSKSGERGIFNREAATNQATKYGNRDASYPYGCNPCSEVILKSNQCCNLSEVVIRQGDTAKELKRKVGLATIMGTMQATLTNFRYLRPSWKKNTEEEALLGVSLTGIMDNELTSGKKGKRELVELLTTLREHAVEINKKWAGILGINASAAISCVKPSGTVGALADCASGIHPRYANKFIRRVRCDKKDPIATLMMDSGFPYESDVYSPEHQVVFAFPMKAPKDAVISDDMTAIEQLEMWKVYQGHWCDHKVSQTVYIKEHEWMEVGAWVYRNFDIMSGVAFLPWSGHGYKQAPFETIGDKEYEELLSKMPKSIDWGRLREYESDDGAITAHKEVACSGDKCEIVDILSKNMK